MPLRLRPVGNPKNWKKKNQLLRKKQQKWLLWGIATFLVLFICSRIQAGDCSNGCKGFPRSVIARSVYDVKGHKGNSIWSIGGNKFLALARDGNIWLLTTSSTEIDASIIKEKVYFSKESLKIILDILDPPRKEGTKKEKQWYDEF